MNIDTVYVNEDVIMNIANALSEDSSDMFFIVAKCAYKVLSKNEKYNRYREKCRELIKLANSYKLKYQNFLVFYVVDRVNGMRETENEISYQFYINEIKEGEERDGTYIELNIIPERIVRVIHTVIRIKKLSITIADTKMDIRAGFHLEYHINDNIIH
jgi:hypothetical protein